MTINYKCDKCDYEWYDKFTRSMFNWYLNFLCKCPKCILVFYLILVLMVLLMYVV